MAETAAPIPIVEHFPNGDNPYPTVDETVPVGTVGHPDAALEHEPIEHEGKVIGLPQGHGVVVETTPTEEQVEALIKGNKPDEGEHWWGKVLRREKKLDELEKAA